MASIYWCSLKRDRAFIPLSRCIVVQINSMTIRTLLVSLTLGAIGSSSFATISHAAILNGDFSNGFQNWEILGDVSVQTDFAGGSSGNPQALLTTASSILLDDGSPAGSFNFSGENPASAQFPGYSFQTFLGLGATSINSGFLPATEGSAIQQIFDANEGDVLSFRFNFLTNDGAFFGNPRDFAFVTLQDTSSRERPIFSIASSTGSLSTSSTGFAQETGWLTYTSSPLTAGTYRLGIGVVDIFGTDKTSALLIDNIALSDETTTPIPEPTSLLLAAFTALGLGSRFKKSHFKKRV